MKTKYVQYYVEGQNEEKLINVLKTELGVIKAGKVHRLNVIEQEITPMHLRPLAAGTMAVLVFDTDTGNIATLQKNIQTLKECKSVSQVVLIPQVPNLEGELMRSCRIKKIEDLLGSRSRKEFKADFIRVTNLAQKLRDHNFDVNELWTQSPAFPYHNIENQSTQIKLVR